VVRVHCHGDGVSSLQIIAMIVVASDNSRHKALLSGLFLLIYCFSFIERETEAEGR
jgi:hypothetical protein